MPLLNHSVQPLFRDSLPGSRQVPASRDPETSKNWFLCMTHRAAEIWGIFTMHYNAQGLRVMMEILLGEHKWGNNIFWWRWGRCICWRENRNKAEICQLWGGIEEEDSGVLDTVLMYFKLGNQWWISRNFTLEKF